MKQTGKTWTTAQGQSIPLNYVPAHEKAAEKYGQMIASKALELAGKIESIRAEFARYAESVLLCLPEDQQDINRFTFYTFDREFKFEYERGAQYVRVYKAICKNPTAKDYTLVELNANSALRFRDPLWTPNGKDQIVEEVEFPEPVPAPENENDVMHEQAMRDVDAEVKEDAVKNFGGI